MSGCFCPCRVFCRVWQRPRCVTYTRRCRRAGVLQVRLVGHHPFPESRMEGRGKDSPRHPSLDNHGMGTIVEELIRRFNEENNEEAGDPRPALQRRHRRVSPRAEMDESSIERTATPMSASRCQMFFMRRCSQQGTSCGCSRRGAMSSRSSTSSSRIVLNSIDWARHRAVKAAA